MILLGLAIIAWAVLAPMAAVWLLGLVAFGRGES
jgi:hypothetical protein